MSSAPMPPPRRRLRPPGTLHALLGLLAAAASFAAAPPEVVVHEPDRHVFALALLPFENFTGDSSSAGAVSAAMESALAASGRFRVYHARLVVSRSVEHRIPQYEILAALAPGIPRGPGATDVLLQPEPAERARVVRSPVVDFEVSGTVSREGERAHVLARLTHVPTGRVVARSDGTGEGKSPVMAAAKQAAAALAAFAAKATAQERADQVVLEFHSGVRTLANAEVALLRLALADPDNFEPQAALLALYKGVDEADDRIILLGRSLLPRLEELDPKDLLVFERLAVDPFEMVAEAQIRVGRHDDAVETLKTALRVYPLHPADKVVLLARAHLGANRHEEAEKALRDVLARSPAHASALLVLAEVAEARRDLSLARERYRDVIRLAPDSLCAARAAERLKALLQSPPPPAPSPRSAPNE